MMSNSEIWEVLPRVANANVKEAQKNTAQHFPSCTMRRRNANGINIDRQFANTPSGIFISIEISFPHYDGDYVYWSGYRIRNNELIDKLATDDFFGMIVKVHRLMMPMATSSGNTCRTSVCSDGYQATRGRDSTYRFMFALLILISRHVFLFLKVNLMVFLPPVVDDQEASHVQHDHFTIVTHRKDEERTCSLIVKSAPG